MLVAARKAAGWQLGSLRTLRSQPRGAKWLFVLSRPLIKFVAGSGCSGQLVTEGCTFSARTTCYYSSTTTAAATAVYYKSQGMDIVAKAKAKFKVVEELRDPAQVQAVFSLYQNEWKAGTWAVQKDLAGVKRTLEKHALLLALVPEPAEQKANEGPPVLAFVVVSGDRKDPLLEDLIVHPAYRGQGLGSVLIRMVLEHPALKYAPHLDLYCHTNLIPFYKRNGFAQVREPRNDRLLMRRVKSAVPEPNPPKQAIAPAPSPATTIASPAPSPATTIACDVCTFLNPTAQLGGFCSICESPLVPEEELDK
eukprot:g47525.t1